MAQNRSVDGRRLRPGDEIPAAQSGEIDDPAQDAAGAGNRGGRGVVPVRVVNEIGRRRRLFDLSATLSDNYEAR